MIVGTRFDLHRLLGVSLVQHFDRGDPAFGDVLDFHRPARRHIAGLDPVVDDRAVEPEGARDIRLAAEDFHEADGAVHGYSQYVNAILTNQELLLVQTHSDPPDQAAKTLVFRPKEFRVLLRRRAGRLHADPGHA